MPRRWLLPLLAAVLAVATVDPAHAQAPVGATTRVLQFTGAPWAFMPHAPAGEEAREAEERAREEREAEGPREGAPIRELPAKQPAKGLGAQGATAGTDGVPPADATPGAPAFSAPSSFNGPGYIDAYAYPPDAMMDVGPSQVLVAVNGRLRSFSKATGLADGAVDVDTDAFFASVAVNYTSDPRVRFDRRSGRWFVVMIDVPASGANHVLVAVSDGATLSAGTTWTFSRFDPKNARFADYPTLGIDGNALYIGAVMFDPSTWGYVGSQVYVVRKADVLAGSPTPAVAKFDLNALSVPQGVDAADDAAGNVGYVVGVDSSSYSKVDVVRISDPGGTPTLGAVQRVMVPTTTSPVNVTSGSSTLDALDDRLFSAVLRGGSIWTAHNIQVGTSGAASGSGGRNGARWYQLDVRSATPSLVQSGTVFDSATTNPRSYWIPALSVNGQGSMVIGGTVAGATATPNAWFAGRLAGDPLGQTSAPVALTSATGGYAPSGDTGTVKRWGDYSFTAVDPSDDMTFWTVQEYAPTSSRWGVRVARILGPPPAAPATGLSVGLGAASLTVTLDGLASGGAAWFDPGAGFARRLTVGVGCGVTVAGVRVLSPTRLSLDLDTRGASLGLCDVTVTNPDGQSATTPAALAVVDLGGLLGGGTTTTTTTTTAATPPPTTTTTTTAPATTTATSAAPPTTTTATTTAAPPATTTTTAAPSTTTTAAPAPRRCIVPRLRGRTRTGARRLLVRAGCALGAVRRVSSRAVRRDRVVRSAPRAGRVLARGARVRIDLRR